MATSKRFQARNGLDNNSLTLIGVATPVNTTDAANKAYADTKLALTGGTLSGSASGSTLELLRLSNTGTGANTKSRLNFYAASGNYGSITGGYGASAPEMVFDINTTAGAYIWNNNATEQMRINASGNLGLGVTPSAWDSIFRAVQVGSANYFSFASQNSAACYGSILWNAYGTGNETFAYNKTGDKATRFAQQYDFRWYLAPSGTAGSTISFTEAMRITSAGNVGIGTNAPSYLLDVAGTSRVNSLSITNQLSRVTPTGVGSSTGGTVPAGTYYAIVEALDINGFSSGYAAVSSGVTTTGSTSSIVWSWTAVAGAASYQIKFDTSPTGGFTKYATTTTNTYTLTVNISTLLSGFPPSTDNVSGSISIVGGAQFGTQANVVSNYSTAILGVTTTQNISASGSVIFNHFGNFFAQGIQGFNQNHTTTPRELRIFNNFSSGDITFFTDSGSGSAKIAQIDAANSCVTIFRQNGTSEGGQLNLAKSIDNSTAFFFDVFGNTADPSLRVVSTKSGVGSVFEINSDGNIIATCSTLSLTNATSKRIDFGTTGVALPSTTQGSPSTGTKLVLYNSNSSAAEVDYGLGISFLSMWYTVPAAASHTFYTSSTSRFVIGSAGARALNGGSIGYGSGSVATPVTQTISRTTAVTSNGLAGAITMFSAVGSATWSSFTVNNTSVVATDTIFLSVRSGTNSTYNMFVTHVTANSFRINFAIVGTAGAADTPIINYTVFKNS